MIIVTWKNHKGETLRLRVLDVYEGQYGEQRFSVCKEECPDPAMGRFSVRVCDTSAADLQDFYNTKGK